jgi:hypothetical protein
MAPRVPPDPRRRPARLRLAGAIAVLIGLVAGAAVTAGPAGAGVTARADSAAADTLSAPADGASAPLATSGAAPFTARGRFGDGIGADRLAHLSLALVIGVGVGLSSRAPAAGAGVTVTLAVAKELLDDRFDRGDLAAGAVGAGLAWLIVTALTP